MKAILKAMLLGALLCMMAAGGLAEVIGPGPAVLWADEQGGFVDMHETADENSAVLMHYYDGTVCDVREIEGGWARVRVGSDTIYLQGYVKAERLRGVEAMRERGWTYGSVHIQQGKTVTVYAACDAHSRVLERIDMERHESICGINGEWAQLSSMCVARSGEWERENVGFIPMKDLTAESVTFGTGDVLAYNVYPTASDLSYEEAYERAIALMLENPDFLYKFDEEKRDEASLRAMMWDLRLYYHTNTGRAVWYFMVQDPESPDGDPISLHVRFDADGNLMDIEPGNG